MEVARVTSVKKIRYRLNEDIQYQQDTNQQATRVLYS
jgi:hypothetical protein